jgi:RimJ/RimL family protein N-acetyltransferase
MVHSILSVRELALGDIDLIADYWSHSDSTHLLQMGVAIDRLPSRDEFVEMLRAQINQPAATKQSYALIWELDSRPVGHCNINKITLNKEGYMHLHLWHNESRKKGLGAAFVKLSIPFFFRNFGLQQLFCEPYALNDAPNKTLAKAGFTFLRSYTTIPGFINFEQPVNLWAMQRPAELAMNEPLSEEFENRLDGNIAELRIEEPKRSW